MKSLGSDWYKKIWSFDIQNQSWTEETVKQADFIINSLNLSGSERILDLACGFGRHSLEFAKRGFSVTGVDITKDYIEYASKQSKMQNLNAEFICSDIRDVSFENEFDVVLNMADGAVGYLENDGENLKIFDVVSKALKSGGKHFMDIMNAGYADTHFPCQLWDNGEKMLTLSKFEWDRNTKIMMYGQLDYEYGKPLPKPNFEWGNPTRLYYFSEIGKIMAERNVKTISGYADITGKLLTDNDIQMLIYSQKL